LGSPIVKAVQNVDEIDTRCGLHGDV